MNIIGRSYMLITSGSSRVKTIKRGLKQNNTHIREEKRHHILNNRADLFKGQIMLSNR